jgi:predicted DNA-binding mobile mystery protein A
LATSLCEHAQHRGVTPYSRRRLGERLAVFTGAAPRPPSGWTKAIRESLGISTAQLAERLGVSQPSVIDLERREAGERITLASLKRAAEALECTLVYALVPKAPLEEMVRDAARRAAEAELAASLHSMGLEDQAPRARDRREMVERLTAEIAEAGGRRLWGRAGGR